jgi:hypothetical protein
MTSLEALWLVPPANEGFDPVMFPEIKPCLARLPDDDELGLRRLLEWPEGLASSSTSKRRARRSQLKKRARRRS